MLQNYEYFLMLAETENISRAAERLFISHQCLSRYLKNLEEECGLTLFERKPRIAITDAGKVLLNALRQIQQAEQNATAALAELKSGFVGEIRLGITEGRLRIFFPELLRSYQKLYPHVTLKASSAPTAQMLDQLLDNKLDLVLGSTTGNFDPNLEFRPILEENLYLVVSDNMLRQYFPSEFPQCKEEFSAGADLRRFQAMPFCSTYPEFHSRVIIDNFLQHIGVSLHYVYEAAQPDLLHILTAQDHAASFCLSMYLPNIRKLNQGQPEDDQLNVFPIQDLNAKNPIYLIAQKEQYFPKCVNDLIALIRQQCLSYCANP